MPCSHSEYEYGHARAICRGPRGLDGVGAIFSAIGGAINAVVSAIASIIMIIVSVIVTIIVTIFDIIFDILCCNCFGGRTRRTGTHRYRFGRGGGATTY
ncbi:hypothetical protein BD413DRAFT_609290 [Trametes elegans]|nr:hypothetical protein BD413DRAFT_609290 [Trametes elegans]